MRENCTQGSVEGAFGQPDALPDCEKRLIYMQIAGKPTVFINPVIDKKSVEMLEVWDDCLCFPDLLVRVECHKSCRISCRDEGWNKVQMLLEGGLSELLQHEFDHLG